MKDSDTIVSTALDLAGLLTDQRERAERAEADLAHTEAERRQLAAQLEEAQAKLTLQRAELPPETQEVRTLRKDLQALQERHAALLGAAALAPGGAAWREQTSAEPPPGRALVVVEAIRCHGGTHWKLDDGSTFGAERVIGWAPAADPPAAQAWRTSGADLLTCAKCDKPLNATAGRPSISTPEGVFHRDCMRHAVNEVGDCASWCRLCEVEHAERQRAAVPPPPPAAPVVRPLEHDLDALGRCTLCGIIDPRLPCLGPCRRPPPAAPEAHPALCTVGDLKPGERAMAVDDLRNFVGHLELERGTLIEADSKERDPALSEAAIRRVLVSSDRLDPRVYFVMKTGCVRRTGAARPAPAPAVEVRGATLVVDGKEHPKAPPGADRFPIEPAGAERCAYDALQPDPARCPDVRSTLELLDAAVNALPEGPAREFVSLARLQWRDGDRASALERIQALDITGVTPQASWGAVTAAMRRMERDIERDGAAAKGVA